MSDTEKLTFYERHPEKLTEILVCPICDGHYKYSNKSHHYRTQKHIRIAELIKKYEEQK